MDYAIYKMLGVQHPTQEKAYRKTYDRYRFIYADRLNDHMGEISRSPLSENFDSLIVYKGSCKLGKVSNLFSILDSVILPRAVLPALSLQLEPEHATPD